MHSRPDSGDIDPALLEQARSQTWPVEVFSTRDTPGLFVGHHCVQPGDVLAQGSGEDVDLILVLKAEGGPVVGFSSERQNYVAYPISVLEELLVPGIDEESSMEHLPQELLTGEKTEASG